MGDWLDYRLSDFLLFSPEVYWRLPERINDWLWPVPIVTTAILAGVLAMMVNRPERAGSGIALIMAMAWAAAGVIFVWLHYVPINWAAVYLLPLIALAALLWLAARGDGPDMGFSGHGIVLVVFAIAYPLIAPLVGRGPWSGEVFALAPDPVAVAGLGAACAVVRPGWRLALALPALLWLGVASVTLWTLGGAAVIGPVAALVIGLVGLVAGPREEEEL